MSLAGFSAAAQQDSAAMKNVSLKGVTVTAKKPFIEQKAGKIVLNMANSPLAAGSNTLEVLQMAPGVRVDKDGNITLNGKKVMVYVDGRPSYLSADALKALLTNTQGRYIDKIELVSNPSAKYDAAGGAMINIRMKREKGLGFNGNVTLGASQGEHFRTNDGVQLTYRAKKVSVYGGYDLSYEKRTGENSSERNTRDFNLIGDGHTTGTTQNHHFRAGLDYTISPQSTAGLSFNAMYNDREGNAYNNSAFFSKQERPDSILTATTTSSGGFFIPSVSAYYKIRLDSTGKELSINGDYYTFNHRSRNLFDTRTDNGPSYLLREHSPRQIAIRSLSADYTHPAKSGHWEAGLKTIFIKTDNDTRWEQGSESEWAKDPGKTNHFIYREWINAAYLNYSKTIGSWEVQAGLRGEHTKTKGHSLTNGMMFTKNYTRLFPNVALQYTLNENQQLSIAYRKSINRPSYQYVNPFLIFESKYAYFRGNPGLNPEMMHTVEVSHVYKGELFTTLSYQRFNGVVSEVYEQDLQSRILYSTYDNLRYSEWLFAGVSWNRQLNSWWTTSTALQGGYIRYHFDDVELRRSVPGFYFSTINSFNIPKVFTMQTAFSYSSRVVSGLQEMKDYWGVDVGFQRSFLDNKLDLKLSFKDIFRSMRFGNISDYNGVRIQTTNYNDSRVVALNFTYRFGNKYVKQSKSKRSGIEAEKQRIGQ